MDNSSTELNKAEVSSPPATLPKAWLRSRPWRGFALAVAALVLAFAVPLSQLVRFAAGSKLYSFILLIPFVSLYLFRIKRADLPATSSGRNAAALFLSLGAALLAAYWLRLRAPLSSVPDDYLALMTACFLLFFIGICGLFWGTDRLRRLAFPLAFLFFMVPIPVAVLAAIDSFLQQGSAITAAWFYRLSGMPFFQDGLSFQLPVITLHIAPECSGIHSTLILLVTSLLAGYVMLRSVWKRTLLVLLVIPLALLRNGFRVFVLGELCVHVSPRMIDSPIHHQGGPIFFVLSLIPFFLILILLQRSERMLKKEPAK